jgi:O-antigen ligase
MAATPWMLAPLAGVLRREWMGALYVLLTAASVDFLGDVLRDVFGSEHVVSFVLLLLSAAYLAQRRHETARVVRDPVVGLLAVFLAQAMLSAAAFGSEDLSRIVQNRLTVLLTLITVAVLVRRPNGARVVPALLIFGALMSAPILLREVLDPQLAVFPSSQIDGQAHRAGGLFAEPNNVGQALSYAVAFAWLAYERLGLSGPGSALIFAVCGVGLLACASRGALGAVLALLAGMGVIWILRRFTRPPIVRALLVCGMTCALAPLIVEEGTQLRGHLEDAGFGSVARLGDVLNAASGSTDDLMENDNHRLALVEQALVLIAERPALGRGTGNFQVLGWRGSHNQFLEVLGENGALGGVLYFCFVFSVVLAVRRAPGPFRATAGLVVMAWLIHHLDNHNMMDHRFMVQPIGWVCGIAGLKPGACALSDDV